MLASCEGWLDKVQLTWDKKSCVCVVISSGGYPGEYETGKEIKGIKEAEKCDNTFVFHAGTKIENKKIVTSGGRVLGVTSLGNGIEGAIENVPPCQQDAERGFAPRLHLPAVGSSACT